jgi:hypothetical protein
MVQLNFLLLLGDWRRQTSGVLRPTAYLRLTLNPNPHRNVSQNIVPYQGGSPELYNDVFRIA